jgi:hypothetical protein
MRVRKSARTRGDEAVHPVRAHDEVGVLRHGADLLVEAEVGAQREAALLQDLEQAFRAIAEKECPRD